MPVDVGLMNQPPTCEAQGIVGLARRLELAPKRRRGVQLNAPTVKTDGRICLLLMRIAGCERSRLTLRWEDLFQGSVAVCPDGSGVADEREEVVHYGRDESFGNGG